MLINYFSLNNFQRTFKCNEILNSSVEETTEIFNHTIFQVDNNVTRHLDKVLTPDENKKPTFDFLVLHYLGLDHIGHLEGARSPKIKPKLLEMDDVVKKIYAAMKTWVGNIY